MKTVMVLTGLFVSATINVLALSIDSITVTGATNASGPVTVSANISGVVGMGFAGFQTTSADGLSRRYFHHSQIAGNSWSDSNWNPYFTGDFIIDVTAFDNSGPPVTASTTVTVTHAIAGTVNSIKYSSAPYDANGVWSNVDTSAVKLHDIGLRQEPGGAASVGCNLLNANPTVTPDMSEEARDVAYTDTGGYKPAGTPYRFNVSLHARPRGFMGMGELKRWIWTPTDTNNPNGGGTLVVDITAVSPWRSSYSNALQSHVGMAPIFAMTDDFNMPTGLIMCTSAHFMDVGPTNTGTRTDARCGLRVDGHTGTNSYLKMFLSDTFLQQQFQLTNVYDATNLLAGFVQHFDTNNVPIDTTAEVIAQFIRIEGGTNNILYDYNSDGIGDSGYEMRFNFEFHSAVVAQMGMASTNQNVSVFAADFDGDGKNDPTLYVASSATWYIRLSASGYTAVPLTDFGGSSYTAVAGDFDGDGKADPAIYQASSGTFSVKLSAGGYETASVTGFGGSGYAPVSGDFDGDGKADPALYNSATGDWLVKLSASGYTTATLSDFGGSGSSEAVGDFDGDGKTDPAIYQASSGTLSVKLSNSDYVTASATLGGSGYLPVSGDFDGDGKADPAVYETATGNWNILLSGSGYATASLTSFGGSGYTLVEGGDFDGDGKADPAIVDTTGVLSVKLSSMGYGLVTLPLVVQ